MYKLLRADTIKSQNLVSVSKAITQNRDHPEIPFLRFICRLIICRWLIFIRSFMVFMVFKLWSGQSKSQNLPCSVSKGTNSEIRLMRLHVIVMLVNFV